MPVGPEIWTLVLAAGGSRRLGRPKQALPLGSETLLRHAVEQAISVTPGKVVCVLGAHVPEAPLPCITCLNPLWQTGMASSLAAGVEAVPAGVGILITLCDQPGVTTPQLALLLETYRKNPERPVAACYGGKAGVPAVFPPQARTPLLSLSGDQGARTLLRSAGLDLETVKMPEAALDIDTDDDWNQWLAGQ